MTIQQCKSAFSKALTNERNCEFERLALVGRRINYLDWRCYRLRRTQTLTALSLSLQLRCTRFCPNIHNFAHRNRQICPRFCIKLNSYKQESERSFNLRPPNWKKCRPISRILSFLRTDHHPSSYVIAYVIKQPTRWLMWAHSNANYLVLLRVGFT